MVELLLCGKYDKANGRMLPLGTYVEQILVNGEAIPNGDFEEWYEGWCLRTTGQENTCTHLCRLWNYQV